ncbi:flagellar hook-associated protein FlgK [Brevundimonas sp.]|uniref:flagellar hook-associated protein FlgK n=1 Tax=Brevundimonas sp. TaxID=1871086 RepID=UPI001A1EF026|nr:flagellar hook-associated protein FlgK [Brevundimonas sp.]MBJ7483266.1 flagellar hook-associated protein FlgK [Brevundimonas sp.]
MSLSSIMNIANSGLSAAQTQLRVVSDNVANVNTPGYVRKIAEQVSLTTEGVGSGVEVARVRLATDRFLQSASLNASADSNRQGVRYELYDRIQTLFGDPGGNSGFFSQVDAAFASFATMAESAGSSPLRQEALFKVEALFDESTRISAQIQSVREDADGRIQTAVEKANDLLQHIETLNVDIARATVINGDASGAETQQATLISQLAELMDVKVSQRSNGGVSIRSSAGLLLAGQGAATLEYRGAGAVNAESTFEDVWVTEPGGQKRSFTDGLKSGEIKGLLELRDVEAPATAERLAELITRVADELNRAHNANASVPAPTTLTGRNVGQTLETALTGFNGQTTIAVTNTSGVIQARADIVFSGSSMTVNGVGTTPANFLTTLNAQLGGAATASFTNGVLSLSATGTNGVAIADDATSPSNKAGRGFSHYFGLNDLVTTDRMALYDVGLTAASQHGFTPGETVTFRFAEEGGARLRDLTVAVPAGTGTMSELLTALNSPVTGVGRYGAFVLDGTTGAVTFRASGSPPAVVSVAEDTTTQTPSGVSLTELFGIGSGVRSSRADGFALRTDIRNNPGKLALAQLNLGVAAGATALSAGDGRGALGLADAGRRSANFQAAGGSVGGTQSIARYSADLSGDIGARAAASKTRAESSQAIQTEAAARQSAYEGVNLDEELVKMTTYQQAFNASARLIQSAKDMYDVLLGMV